MVRKFSLERKREGGKSVEVNKVDMLKSLERQGSMSRSKKKKSSHSAGITDAGVLEDLMHSNDRKGGDEDAVIKVNIG